MKKKLITLCFSLFVAVSLAGCGEKETADMDSIGKMDTENADEADTEDVGEMTGTDDMEGETVDDSEESESAATGAAEVIFDYMAVLEERPLNEIQSPGYKKGLPASLSIYMPGDEYISEDYEGLASMGMYHYGVTYDEEYEAYMDLLFMGFGTLPATSFNETFEEDIVERYGSYSIVTMKELKDSCYGETIYILEDGSESGIYISFRSDFEEQYDVVKAIASQNMEYIKEQIQ